MPPSEPASRSVESSDVIARLGEEIARLTSRAVVAEALLVAAEADVTRLREASPVVRDVG